MSDRRTEEADQRLSEVTNSIMFVTLVLYVIAALAWRHYEALRLQQECRDQGGYVETTPETNFFDGWTCRREDRD